MTRWIQNIKRVLTLGVIVCVTAFGPQHTIAQQAALPMLESEAPTEQSTDLSLGLSQNEFYSNVDVLTCGKVSLVVSSVCEIEKNNSLDPYCFSQTVSFLTKNGNIKTHDYHYKKSISQSFIYGASCIYHNGEYYFYLTNSNLGSCKNCEWNDFFHSNGSYLGSSAWINSWTSFKRKMISEKYEAYFLNKKEEKFIDITIIKK